MTSNLHTWWTTGFHLAAGKVQQSSTGSHNQCRMLTRRGVPCTAYLDDFLLCGPDFDSCQTALNMLVYTLRQLGFRINWNKVVDPTQRLVFLGIQLDTVRNTMCLDPPKQSDICGLLEHYAMIKHVSRAKLE